MIKYDVKRIPGSNAQFIRGPFAAGSVPVNLPEDEPLKKEYISLFLHQRDIEVGIDCLRLLQPNMPEQMQLSLFTTALINLMKCFQKSNSRVILRESTFLKENKELKEKYCKYKNWRNNHFAHDGGILRDANAYLLLSPEESEAVLGGPVSVGWIPVQIINYLQEAVDLEEIMQAVWRFIVRRIDELGEILYKKYSVKTRDELESYGIIGEAVRLEDWDSEDIAKLLRVAEDTGHGQTQDAQR